MGSCRDLPKQASTVDEECPTILPQRAYRDCIYSFGIPVLVLKRKAQGVCGFQHGILENDCCDVAGARGRVRLWNSVYRWGKSGFDLGMLFFHVQHFMRSSTTDLIRYLHTTSIISRLCLSRSSIFLLTSSGTPL